MGAVLRMVVPVSHCSVTTRQALVRFYIDADMLGLAKVLAAIRLDVTFPGDPGTVIKGRRRAACAIAAPATKDVGWIPIAATHEWVVIARDAAIARRPAKTEAVRTSGARLVALSSHEARETFTQLEVVMSQSRWLGQRYDEPGPYVYSLARTSSRRLI